MCRLISCVLLAACLAGCGGGGPRVAGNASGGRLVGADASTSPGPVHWWRPAPSQRWQIQYSGTLDLGQPVAVYDIDLFDTPAGTIRALHGQGKRVVCYFSAGSFENWRPDAGRFPAAVLGAPLQGWPGERWLDVGNLAVLGPIMEARLDLAAGKGCDGVDPDNVDAYTQHSGFRLGAGEQIRYNRFIAAQAHARGLAVGLKNDLNQVPQLLGDFDFAVNESCYDYDECDRLHPFIRAGKPVFSIEYARPPGQFCPQAAALGFNAVYKREALDASVQYCPAWK